MFYWCEAIFLEEGGLLKREGSEVLDGEEPDLRVWVGNEANELPACDQSLFSISRIPKRLTSSSSFSDDMAIPHSDHKNYTRGTGGSTTRSRLLAELSPVR